MAKLNRRIFLRGLGGAAVAAPFLSSLFERSARAAFVAPKRTIVMFTHYGCITNKWFPSKLDGELTAEDLKPTTLAPLAPYAKKLLMPRGIRTMNEWTVNNKGAGKGLGQGNDMHVQGAGSLFTCQPLTPNSNDPFSFDQATKFSPMPIGPSLDHVMANQLSPDGAPLLLNVAGVARESAQSAISYKAAETTFPSLNATRAYTQLTGLFDDGSPMNADTWAVTKGKTITDIVKHDLESLARRDMSKSDKDKLNAWMALTNDLGRVIANSQCGQAQAAKLGASNPLATGTSTDGDVLTRRINDSMDNADLYAAIATLAAACNANPVIFLKFPSNFIFKGLGISADSHNLSHRLDNANMSGPCVPNAVENLLKIDGYYAQKFANLVRMLDSINEGDATLLDNLTAVWLSDFSDGCAHNQNNLPIIQAGSSGGYFKTGKVIDLDPGSGATPEIMLGRSLSQCTEGTTTMADGVSKGTGTEPMYGNAPVNKYFCNLMNAMGIKAGADGFPAKDGPASEVTHYGYSDRTEDFCGGAGAVPGAGIHDPGAFGLLKA
ncbi:MAG TPA: DUF1552 domain-containing protein [Polyangiaceae bacterium]|nr:DUF1552 domain-containing protein [Polyangiaceae bacterium]